jgi:hypothetical protein
MTMTSRAPGSTDAPYGNRVEFAATRKIRERNTPAYRLAHWPVWTWVFFLVRGPLVAYRLHNCERRGRWRWVVTLALAAGRGA